MTAYRTPPPLLTAGERRQVIMGRRLSGARKARIGAELCEMGRKILLDGLRRQFGGDERRLQAEFRRRLLPPELVEAVERRLKRDAGHD